MPLRRALQRMRYWRYAMLRCALRADSALMRAAERMMRVMARKRNEALFDAAALILSAML